MKHTIKVGDVREDANSYYMFIAVQEDAAVVICKLKGLPNKYQSLEYTCEFGSLSAWLASTTLTSCIPDFEMAKAWKAVQYTFHAVEDYPPNTYSRIVKSAYRSTEIFSEEDKAIYTLMTL